MDDDLFLSEQHAHSRRWAVVEDDGSSAWLYLTAPESTKPVAICWLYNRTTGSEPFQPPSAQSVSFRWSASGEAVAVLFGADLIGFIAGASGYSRHLKTASPFGSPLDTGLYSSEFGEA
jgi:hypothetical protein